MNSKDSGLPNETVCGGTPNDLPQPDDKRRVWVTPTLNRERYDEIWWRSLDDALDYIDDHLTEHIACKFNDVMLIEDGYTFLLTSKLVDAEDWSAVFDHDETVDVKG